jgi:hypothetical protein
MDCLYLTTFFQKVVYLKYAAIVVYMPYHPTFLYVIVYLQYTSIMVKVPIYILLSFKSLCTYNDVPLHPLLGIYTTFISLYRSKQSNLLFLSILYN